MIDESVQRRLEGLREEKRLEKFHEDIRTLGGAKTFRCLGPGCENGIRVPRMLKLDGKRRPSVTWCSQDCVDRYVGQFKLRPLAHEVRNAETGELVGFVVSGKGRVRLEDIEAARESKVDVDAGPVPPGR